LKALILLSGGLDSILAARLILDQGIDLVALNFLTVFCTCTSKNKSCLASQSAANQLNIPVKVMEVSQEYLAIVKNPKYGYGKNLNPCLDCRIFMFRKAKRYMEEVGAQFIVTGEVLGERPMSQRREAIALIEKEAGLAGLILRPLSAHFFPTTWMEKEGVVDRERLLRIRGRSRNPQIELARHLGIKDYPCPAGGCLLTDPGFSERMRDLKRFHPDFDLKDVRWLKLGRHFRLTAQAKLIIGRKEEENRRILNLKDKEDYLLEIKDVPGPLAVLRGEKLEEIFSLASGILLYYVRRKGGKKVVIKRGEDTIEEISSSPVAAETLKTYLIGMG
jgi:tRNA U34 2-thiouridine synthase MnmA/TrmU